MSDGLYAPHSIRANLVWATIISCLSTFQFGFHLSVFNAPQEILLCRLSVPGPFADYSDTFWALYNRDQCLPMSLAAIASINTMFTLGGLVSSTVIGCHTINKAFGRTNLQKFLALLFFAGSLVTAFANSVWMLNFGRLLAGLAAGAGMVVAPILISELAPFNHRGLMGLLLQFGVSIGILTAQLIAFMWSNDQQWRNLFVFGAGLGLAQFALLHTTVESPKWLIMHKNDVLGATEILHTLRSDKLATHLEINHWRRLSVAAPTPRKAVADTTALLEAMHDENDDALPAGFTPLSKTVSRRGSIDPSSITAADYVFGTQYRHEWLAVVLIMTAQQLSGMNAITFYGVSVMANVVPKGTNVLYLTSSLALTNVVAALAVSPLIDHWGRKPLLLLSVLTMALFSLLISIGLVYARDYLATVSCFGFIVGYSLGLGQIPFLMVSELASHETIGLAQSLGTMSNWFANIAVAFLFPQLKDLLGGSVFLVFVLLGGFFFVSIKVFVPETKGKVEYEDVWEDYQ